MESFACRDCEQMVIVCEECPIGEADPLARECACGRMYCLSCWVGAEEHHWSVKLFEPAAAQIVGQLGMGLGDG